MTHIETCIAETRRGARARILLAAVAIALALASIESICAAEQTQAVDNLSDRQLIVLFDPARADSPSPSAILSAVSLPLINAALHAQLAAPVAAEWPMAGLTSPDLQRELAKNPQSPRARLERYVILTYPDVAAARSARSTLLVDDRVLVAGPNITLNYAFTPVDTYFSINPIKPYAGQYQWGMQLLNLPSAWDRVRGTAYIGEVDHGIYCQSKSAGVCTPHADLQQNFRQQFSRNMNGGDVDEITNEIDTTHAGHGTHVAGIIAGTPNNSTGIAGACFSCSLSVIKLPTGGTHFAAIAAAVDSGMQVLNYSLSDDQFPQYDTQRTCDDPVNDSFKALCDAIAYAKNNDVVFVAASGNNLAARIGFPALNDDAVAVGGIKYGGAFWDNGRYRDYCDPSSPHIGLECGSNFGNQQNVTTLQTTTQQVVAPAMNVISTFYPNFAWNPDLECRDTYAQASNSDVYPMSGQVGSGYADCRGTSMAAPHVTGIVGLMRTANPLTTRGSIKSMLLNTANTISCLGSDTRCGAGIPDAAKLVTAALGGAGVINRTTPLFSFYSNDRVDHLYTVVPQMGTAAIVGTLLPTSYTGLQKTYATIGPLVGSYTWFPGVPSSMCGFSPPCDGFYPRAMVSVFTTFRNPILPSVDLVPLYRLSWRCPNSSACPQNSNHVSHVYSTNTSERWVSQQGYSVDGIEGYIFPVTMAQPPGTIKLCRKRDSSRDDYVLFPGTGTNGTSCTNTTDGYTGGNYSDPVVDTDWIGWVYPAQAPRPVYATSIVPNINVFMLD